MRTTNNRQQELTPEQTTRIDRLLAAQKKYLDRADDTIKASNELNRHIREAVDAGVTRRRVMQELGGGYQRLSLMNIVRLIRCVRKPGSCSDVQE